MEIPKNMELILDNEGVKKECAGGFIASGLITSGRLYLTQNRIAFKRDDSVLSGLLNMINKSKKGDYQFNILTMDIESFKKGKFGLNKNILEIETKSGLQLKFVVNKLDPWLTEISKYTSPNAFRRV